MTVAAVLALLEAAAPYIGQVAMDIYDALKSSAITKAQALAQLATAMKAEADKAAASDAGDAARDAAEEQKLDAIEATKPDNATAMAETPKVTPAEFVEELKAAAAETVEKKP